jgi:cell division protein FtsZ
MRMREIEEAATLVQEQAHEDANIIFGATIDENMGDMIKVTVIATGFDHPVAEIPTHLGSAITGRPATSLSVNSSPLGMSGGAPSGRISQNPQTLRQPQRPAEEQAYPSRRAPQPQQQAAGSTPPSGPPTRERSTFVPPLDSDWDTPAFQRRGQ